MPFCALVIFDLDGTLADSFPWFVRNVNSVADRFGFRRVRDEAEVQELRHADTREILRRLEVPLWKLPGIAREMRRLKTEQAGDIPLFPGVHEMLETLASAGIMLALVSSDSEANARQKLGASAGLLTLYDCDAALFGKPAKFRRVIRRARVEPAVALSVGDEVRDIEAARAAGMACAAVTWGYAAPEALRSRRPDLVFETIADIVPALTSHVHPWTVVPHESGDT